MARNKSSASGSKIVSQLKKELAAVERRKQLSSHCRKVFDLLMRSEKPLSAYDILDELRDQGLRAPPTVYRALDYLIKNELVHRIESLNAFIACRCHAAHNGVCQFAVCSECGAVEEIQDEAFIAAVTNVKQKLLKQIDSKTMEVSGICRSCSAKAGE